MKSHVNHVHICADRHFGKKKEIVQKQNNPSLNQSINQ